MSQVKPSLFKTAQLDDKFIHDLFSKTKILKTAFESSGHVRKDVDTDRAKELLVLLMFLEPSTRTRLSFETAAKRLGLQVIAFDEASSSIKKGESQVDTFRNLAALQPNLVVARHGEDPALERALENAKIPVISGGQSAHGHPTQALLDLFTVEDEFKSVQGRKILFVGDVKRGRAALSTLEIFSRFGGKIGWVGPKELGYEGPLNVERFSKLDQATAWADVVIGLRLQNERTQFGAQIELQKYAADFCLTPASVRALKTDAIIMHPGPFIQGVDFDEALLNDSRSRVLRQVTNGLFVRMALICEYLGLWRSKT